MDYGLKQGCMLNHHTVKYFVDLKFPSAKSVKHVEENGTRCFHNSTLCVWHLCVPLRGLPCQILGVHCDFVSFIKKLIKLLVHLLRNASLKLYHTLDFEFQIP